ncbi:MAG: DUF393 domain-containing protein [Verrucomicrobia bacterium]|jgi:predicted DCC family thiol-disulfide oxidoreductase YuxK|nr:DUF393 domain-containing protein [Verrucomicrobiota bacterium]
MKSDGQSPILFYDGECGLCSRSVRFLMKRDRADALKYAPIQGETAKIYLSPTLREQLSTVIYYRPCPSDEGNRQRLLRSEAILSALIDTGSAWRWPARIARCLPRSWRDVFYNWVARNRHRFFPKGSCPLPDSAERTKLLP